MGTTNAPAMSAVTVQPVALCISSLLLFGGKMNKSLCRLAAAIAMAAGLAMSGSAQAVVIDFTGGTVNLADGTTGITNNSLLWQDSVRSYDEGGFRFAFNGGYGTVGNYYSIGSRPNGSLINNDVVHAHWEGLSSTTITALDGALFDLNYIDLTSNTTVGGDQATGSELSYIWNDAGYAMLLPSSDWGIDYDYYGDTGDGVARLYLDHNFDNVRSVTFTSENAYCFGMDNFYINEPAPPLPEPSSLALLGLGVVGLLAARRRHS